jgi:integrase
MAELIKIKDVTPEEWQNVNEKNRKMTEEFLAQSLQLSPQTLKQYRSGLMIYWRWVMENADNKPFHEIKAREYLRYQNYLTTSGLSSSAVKFKRSAVSTFNNYVELYYGDDYPLFRNYVSKGIATPAPVAVKEKLPLTLVEYENLCAELEKQELWQQLAYVRFSFATGARRAEVRQLLKEVIIYEGKTIETATGSTKVYLTHPLRCKGKGKEGKVRKLNFDDVAMLAIKKWLDVRGEDDCPYVFVSMHGGVKQSAENTFNSWADTYFSPIVGRRVHPHLFRESRATTMVVEQNKDIKSAQKLLGHTSSQTTEIYVIRKDEDNSDEAFT